MDNRQILNKLLRQYSDTFNNTFPIRFMSVSVEEAIKILQECLDKREPYEVDVDEDDIL